MEILRQVLGFWYLDEDIASRIEWANQYKVQPFEKLEEDSNGGTWYKAKLVLVTK